MPIDLPEPLRAPTSGNELCYECDGKRICIYCRGRRQLANGKRCSTCHGDGRCIVCNGAGELPEGSETLPMKRHVDAMRKLVEIKPSDLRERGFTSFTITVDAESAGMSARLFPAKNAILALNGPPGGTLVLVIWDCTDLPQDLECAIHARLVPPWTNALEMKHRDIGTILGEQREGTTFFTGSGRARIAWFAVLIGVREARVLVACGVPGSDSDDVPAAEVLSNPSIKSAVESLHIS